MLPPGRLLKYYAVSEAPPQVGGVFQQPPRIVETVPEPEGALLLRFADGTERLFGVKPYLRSKFFRSLGDDAYYGRFSLASSATAIQW